MTWVRCQAADFDGLAGAGNPGWGWRDLAPYFAALDGDGKNDGIIKVNRHPEPYPAADAFIESGRAIGLPVREDLRDAGRLGVGYLHSNIDANGRRCSAATGFLKPARKLANLRVETGVRIDRVVFDGRRATAVEGRRRGRPVTYRARREIVLSCGALESPQILQRSGVGPAGLLEALDIPLVHDSPGVGRNMREHLLLNLNFEVKSWRDTENRMYSGWRLLAQVARYYLTRRGPMAQSPYHAAAFASTDDQESRPNVQLMFGPFTRNGQVFDGFPGINIFGYLLRPQSAGYLRITSKDPDAAPLIVPSYATDERDRRDYAAMIRTIRHLAAQPPLAERIRRETAPTADAQSDDELIDLILKHGRPGYHTTGTCSMGQDQGAVVDECTRVRGVDGLRVMDCSIYPTMMSGNLNAPTMAAAMRAADMILDDQGAAG